MSAKEVKEELLRLLKEQPAAFVEMQRNATKLIADEEATAKLEERKGHVATLAKAREQQLQEQKPALAAYEKAKANTKGKHRELQAAEAEERTAYCRLRDLNAAADRVVRDAVNELLRTAPPVLEEKKREYELLLDRARLELRPWTEGRGELNWHNERMGPYYSNRQSIAAYLDTLRDAIRVMDELRLEALSDEEVARRLAEIDAGLPDPNEAVKVGD